METVTYKNIRFQVWDLGGQTSIRPYWRCYYPNTQAIIYVVDSSDTERISTSAGEFHLILEEEELKDAIILVYANKQVRVYLNSEACCHLDTRIYQVVVRSGCYRTSCLASGKALQVLDTHARCRTCQARLTTQRWQRAWGSQTSRAETGPSSRPQPSREMASLRG